MKNDSQTRTGAHWRRHPLELSFEAHRRILLLRLRLRGTADPETRRRRVALRPGRRRDRSTNRR